MTWPQRRTKTRKNQLSETATGQYEPRCVGYYVCLCHDPKRWYGAERMDHRPRRGEGCLLAGWRLHASWSGGGTGLVRRSRKPLGRATGPGGSNPPPLSFRKPRIACRDPVQVAGFSRLSGEFGGNSGANSSGENGRRRTDQLRMGLAPHRRADMSGLYATNE